MVGSIVANGDFLRKFSVVRIYLFHVQFVCSIFGDRNGRPKHTGFSSRDGFSGAHRGALTGSLDKDTAFFRANIIYALIFSVVMTNRERKKIQEINEKSDRHGKY